MYSSGGAIVKDEPVKQFLGNSNSNLVQHLLDHKYGGDESMIPTIDYLSTSPSRMPTEVAGVEQLDGKYEVTYKISGVVPVTSLWLENLVACSSIILSDVFLFLASGKVLSS